ncbi:MAG TPA: hypothetical protein EYP22_02495 [Methanosarcinales archaeon]|nr:hypothetical protein [Methanosarcinales archaeon]
MITKKDNGQISIDFLTAVAIFLLTFTFLITQIPEMFAPFQTQSTDLQPVAYRTSVILVEDTGWWGGINGSVDWENGDHINYLSRIGLAANKYNPNNLTDLLNRGKTNVLSENKINALKKYYDNGTNYTEIQQRLGLNMSTRRYDYNISLQYLNSTTLIPKYIPNNTVPLLLIGKQISRVGEVEKMVRLVTLEGNTTVGSLTTTNTNNTTIINSTTLTLPALKSFLVKFESFPDEGNTSKARLYVTLQNVVANITAINESGTNILIKTHQFNETLINNMNATQNNITINIAYVNVTYMWINRSNYGDLIGYQPSAKLVVYIW